MCGVEVCDMRAVALGLAGLAVSLLYWYRVRPWFLRWGATDEELRRSLPGDELEPQPRFLSTRAITIEAPPEEVWPWLAQMGYGRGGFYSYDRLENIFTRLAGMRSHYRSAESILPQFQTIEEGDFIPAAPQDYMGGRLAGKMGWRVVQVLQGQATVVENWGLVLEKWGTFFLEPIDEGRTRLIVRTRGRRTLSALISNGVWELPHFIMERGMLRGIKRRAERLATERRNPSPE
jgi:hypothetical protein